MSLSVPKPSLLALVVQSLLIIALGVCLFLFVRVIDERESYRKAAAELGTQRQNLQRAIQTLSSYNRFVEEHPFYQRSTGEIQWEKNDEIWVNLAYEDLLVRLQGIYRDDRPFVLDYFSAHIAGVEDVLAQGDGQPKPLQQKSDSTGPKELIFNLQGYFLCPCN